MEASRRVFLHHFPEDATFLLNKGPKHQKHRWLSGKHTQGVKAVLSERHPHIRFTENPSQADYVVIPESANRIGEQLAHNHPRLATRWLTERELYRLNPTPHTTIPRAASQAVRGPRRKKMIGYDDPVPPGVAAWLNTATTPTTAPPRPLPAQPGTYYDYDLQKPETLNHFWRDKTQHIKYLPYTPEQPDKLVFTRQVNGKDQRVLSVLQTRHDQQVKSYVDTILEDTQLLRQKLTELFAQPPSNVPLKTATFSTWLQRVRPTDMYRCSIIEGIWAELMKNVFQLQQVVKAQQTTEALPMMSPYVMDWLDQQADPPLLEVLISLLQEFRVRPSSDLITNLIFYLEAFWTSLMETARVWIVRMIEFRSTLRQQIQDTDYLRTCQEQGLLCLAMNQPVHVMHLHEILRLSFCNVLNDIQGLTDPSCVSVKPEGWLQGDLVARIRVVLQALVRIRTLLDTILNQPATPAPTNQTELCQMLDQGLVEASRVLTWSNSSSGSWTIPTTSAFPAPQLKEWTLPMMAATLQNTGLVKRYLQQMEARQTQEMEAALQTLVQLIEGDLQAIRRNPQAAQQVIMGNMAAVQQLGDLATWKNRARTMVASYLYLTYMTIMYGCPELVSGGVFSNVLARVKREVTQWANWAKGKFWASAEEPDYLTGDQMSPPSWDQPTMPRGTFSPVSTTSTVMRPSAPSSVASSSKFTFSPRPSIVPPPPAHYQRGGPPSIPPPSPDTPDVFGALGQ